MFDPSSQSRTLRFLPLLSLLMLVALSPVVALADQTSLVVGLIPPENAQVTQKLWQPLIEDMSKALGIPVESKVFEDYAGVIWSMKANKVQLAWMGNKAATEAVDHAGGQVAVITLGEDEQAGYRSHIIVPANSPISNIQDLLREAPALSFGIGDPNSTSGTLVPGYYVFARKGLDPAALFKRMTQGQHEENFLAVAQGRVDAATSNSVGLERYRSMHPELYKKIKIIWASPLIPNSPLVWRKSLSRADKDRILSFLIGYGRMTPGKNAQQLQHEKEVLASLKWSGFKESDDGQLAPVRQLELFKLRLQVEADPAMPPADKKPKLKEIDVRLQSLTTGSEETHQ